MEKGLKGDGIMHLQGGATGLKTWPVSCWQLRIVTSLISLFIRTANCIMRGSSNEHKLL